jgi:hypothetical protein
MLGISLPGEYLKIPGRHLRDKATGLRLIATLLVRWFKRYVGLLRGLAAYLILKIILLPLPKEVS